MASRLNPYISFKDNAREALEFYRSVFGGELNLTTFADFGRTGPEADLIMHGLLDTSAGYTIMGSDTPPGVEFRPGNTMTVSISGDDGDALRGYWERLSEGGTLTMPMQKQAWGDEFGMCIDRFGVSWMIDIAETSG